MTRESIKQSVMNVLKDRPIVALMAAMLMSCIAYCIVVGLTIQVRDVQVYTRYTGFGQAHFYKNPWQYTLLFVAFGLVVTTIHSALMVKLINLQRRQTALLLGWGAIIVLFVAGVYVFSILRLAFQ